MKLQHPKYVFWFTHDYTINMDYGKCVKSEGW